MTQPNVFWTLLTPLATIIGLYTNVPEGGSIHQEQLDWLVGELVDAPQDKPVFLTMHHPVYSLDDHHSGSETIRRATETTFQRAHRFPDLVLAGHVHDMQRFTRRVADREIPYIVAGGGGYHNLHRLVRPNGQKIIPPVRVAASQDDLVLESYVDSRFGFLRIEVTPETVQGKYYTVPRPQESWSDPPALADVFELDWRQHRVRANALPQGTIRFESSISGVRF
jgi:3',5'-cyclic AMP phosphodiesterase CpdA